MELITSHRWCHLPGVLPLLHGVLQRVHHSPHFLPVEDSIFVGVEILELVAKSVSIKVNSLHGFQDEQGELLKLAESELLVVVFVGNFKHFSYHVLEFLTGHVRSGQPVAGDHGCGRLGVEVGLEFDRQLALSASKGFCCFRLFDLAIFLSVSSGFLGFVSGHNFLFGSFILVLLLD